MSLNEISIGVPVIELTVIDMKWCDLSSRSVNLLLQ